MLSSSRHILLGVALLLALESTLFAAGNLVDGIDADLIYNPATGNVQLDARDRDEMRITSFFFKNDQNNFRVDNFVAPFIDVGTNTDNTTFQIGQTDPVPTTWENPTNLGDIFPTGMSQRQLADYLTAADYASVITGGSLDLIVVPEPNRFSLAFNCLLLVTSWRRKRHP